MPGGSGTAWVEQLATANYLTNKDIVLCPSQKPSKYVPGGQYQTYGMTVPKSWPTTDNYHVFWGGFLYAGFNFKRVQHPTKTTVLCDTVYIEAGSANNLKQYYATYKKSGSYAENKVHFRHNNQANFLFVDGHANKASVGKANQFDGVVSAWNIYVSGAI